jgi:hypothetical protein
VNTWEEKAPRLSALAATFSRVCDTMSHELQNLYALEERLRQATDKGLHIVIEHVESHWRTEAGAPDQLYSPETGHSEH